MSYFVSPREETDLNVDEAILTRNLDSRWPEIEVSRTSNPESNHVIEWSLRIDGRLLEGSLDKTRQVTHLDGDVRDCARFAVWFRSLIPDRYELAFYDEAYSADVELTEMTTEDEVAAPFLL